MSATEHPSQLGNASKNPLQSCLPLPPPCSLPSSPLEEWLAQGVSTSRQPCASKSCTSLSVAARVVVAACGKPKTNTGQLLPDAEKLSGSLDALEVGGPSATLAFSVPLEGTTWPKCLCLPLPMGHSACLPFRSIWANRSLLKRQWPLIHQGYVKQTLLNNLQLDLPLCWEFGLENF